MLSRTCLTVTGCPMWQASHFALDDTVSMIGNVSSDIGILILQGKNDSSTPLEQGLLMQQRLKEVDHPDHLLITYLGLGHLFYPTNIWMDSYPPVPIEEFVLQDILQWVTSPAREVFKLVLYYQYVVYLQ